MNNSKRQVPREFACRGVDATNASKAWFAGFDAATAYYETVIDKLDDALGPASDDIIATAREEALNQ